MDMTECEHKYGDSFCPKCGTKLHTKEKPKFPVRTSVYLHSSKDSMYEKGEELGLSQEAINKFMYCCYEIEIEMDVNEDGSYKILNCAG